MNRCPICYEQADEHGRYASRGLKKLSPRLRDLEDLPFTAEEQVREAARRASKMSIQGVQPKLSARLNLKMGRFGLVDTGGRYILKPQNPMFPHLPENEDLTMRMAKLVSIEVPLHGMVYSRDRSLTYFIKRFDRTGRSGKLAVEDFSQLTGNDRETKYDSSMEKVAAVIEKYCTFPLPEKAKLFRLTLFNFLVGNEDMHLKNFSLITRGDRVQLSPAYDLLSTTIALERPVEETALPIKGKKKNLTRGMLFRYFARERLALTEKVIGNEEARFKAAIPEWERLIGISFLPERLKERYYGLLSQRRARLKL